METRRQSLKIPSPHGQKQAKNICSNQSNNGEHANRTTDSGLVESLKLAYRHEQELSR